MNHKAICGRRIYDSISGKNMAPYVTKTSDTSDTRKQIRWKTCLLWKTFSDLRIYDWQPLVEDFSHHHPLPLEICKGQKIENTRPTLIPILKKIQNSWFKVQAILHLFPQIYFEICNILLTTWYSYEFRFSRKSKIGILCIHDQLFPGRIFPFACFRSTGFKNRSSI